MKQTITAVILVILLLGSVCVVQAVNVGSGKEAKQCDTIIVGKDASADGSVLLGHNEDLYENTAMHIYAIPRIQHEPGEVIETYFGAEVPQVNETYAYLSIKVFDVDWCHGDLAAGINEFQVAMANNLAYSKETALRPKHTGIVWSEFMQIALERAETAEEAVNIIGWLAEEYGQGDIPGTLFGITDPNEGWWIEIGWKHWVAKKVPDNAAEARVNYFGIGTEFDLSSPDVIDFAIEQGWYDPNSGPFNWTEVYGDPTSEGYQDWNWLRQWRMESLLDGYAPDGISIPEITSILRDHYEGTEYDETNGYQLGSPHKFTRYWDICNKLTVESFVAQSRSWLPAEIGGVVWTSFSRPCTSVFVPWYEGITDTPLAYRTGTNGYDKNSAWWAFERLGGLVDKKYGDRIQYVRDNWASFEAEAFQEVVGIEATALQLYMEGDITGARDVLTTYSCGKGMDAMDLAMQMYNILR